MNQASSRVMMLALAVSMSGMWACASAESAGEVGESLDTATQPCTGGPQGPSCVGKFRTQTQGAWGANARGNNSAAYRQARFAAAFPSGLSVGCTNKLTLSSANAVASFLPSGGTPRVLDTSRTNPTSSYGNTFAGQLVAATLNGAFDRADAAFSSSTTALLDLPITRGKFAGMTGTQLLAEANRAFGGCGSTYSASELSDALDSFNRAFDDGNTATGYLACSAPPPPPPPPELWVQCDDEPGLEIPKDLVVWTTGTSGQPISQTISCSAASPHEYLKMPAGVTRINCPVYKQARFFYGAPSDDILFYAKTCAAGETPTIDRAGGPAAVVCPAEGKVTFYGYDFFGQEVPVDLACTSGSIVDTNAYMNQYMLGRSLNSKIQCPASGGFRASYYGKDSTAASVAPTSTSQGQWVDFTCVAGSITDLTRITL